MTSTGWNNPAEDRDNPHRLEERQHVRDELEARLRERDVDLRGDESDAEIILMIDAIEEFEGLRARAGGDSFTNTPQSSQPDDERFVVPQRRDDEGVQQFVRRVREKIESLR
jgi:hypothetical protein